MIHNMGNEDAAPYRPEMVTIITFYVHLKTAPYRIRLAVCDATTTH